jgi:two-component system sensor histidine kinase GlrK
MPNIPAIRSLSMPALVLMGFSLVALPLIAVIFMAAIYVDRLELESERLVIQGIQVTRLSDSLSDSIEKMEHNARQYQAEGDESLVEACAARQAEFSTTLDLLKNLSNQKMPGWDLEQMRADSQLVVQALRSFPPDSPMLAAALQRFDVLRISAARITAEGNRLIDSEMDSLQHTGRDAKRFLVWPSVVLIPGALLLVLVFTYLIVRPIRRLADAIHLIGVGKFARPIDIGGPPELEALGRKLDWLRTRLVMAEEEKNAFLRRMSHELKTPLASVREGTELLLDETVGQLTPSQREVAAILQGTGLELQYLIENLLNFSEWHEKKAELKLQTFDLSAVIHYVLRRHQLGLANKHITLHSDFAEIQMLADRERIRMALDNLVSNAVKFTPPRGDIYVRARSDSRETVIEVADTGPGIPADERRNVFDAFFQGSAPQMSHVRGTGIGLSVVSECIRAHGGLIEIVDGEFPGAHFRIRLSVGQVRPVN